MLTLTRHVGEGFYIDDVEWRVCTIDAALVSIELVKGGAFNRDFIRRTEGAEIMPGVFVSRGRAIDEDYGTCKLVFSAPRSIRILRTEIYEEERRQNAAGELPGPKGAAA